VKVELLREVRKQILAAPERFYMGNWMTQWEANISGDLCGTACCIGGWAGVLSGLMKKKATDVDTVESLTRKGRLLASRSNAFYDCDDDDTAILSEHKLYREALKLDEDQANRLFYEHKWPAQFKMNFKDAPWGSKARARIAAKRITHFIKTKGTE
jgi:hypothetical protein